MFRELTQEIRKCFRVRRRRNPAPLQAVLQCRARKQSFQEGRKVIEYHILKYGRECQIAKRLTYLRPHIDLVLPSATSRSGVVWKGISRTGNRQPTTDRGTGPAWVTGREFLLHGGCSVTCPKINGAGTQRLLTQRSAEIAPGYWLRCSSSSLMADLSSPALRLRVRRVSSSMVVR